MSTVLPKSKIRLLLNNKPPLIEEFIDVEEQLQPNGFDLTLRDISRLVDGGSIAVDNKSRYISETARLSFDNSGWIKLAPGPYVVTFNEIVNLPDDIIALAKTRSSLLRSGVAIHNAVWDAGYHGRSQALMVVYNPDGFRVQQNARVIQMIFLRLSAATEKYRGIYQNENIGG